MEMEAEEMVEMEVREMVENCRREMEVEELVVLVMEEY